MKNKFTIWFAILLIVAVIGFMAKDFFFKDNNPQKNPYNYNIDKLKDIPEEQICYSETKIIKPSLKSISSISIDDDNRIFVAGDKGVEIFNDSLEKVNSLEMAYNINCIYVNNENLFLGTGDQIKILNHSGEEVKSWVPVDTGVVLTSIAVKDSSIFLADAGNKIVYQYNLNGTLINTIGRKDTAQGIPGFIIPSPYFDLAIGRENQLWVVNPGRHAFEAYDFDGRLISRWAKTSMQLEGFSGCCNPSNFAMLADGSFVTSEKGIERVKIHTADGKFKCVVAAPNKFEEGTKGIDLAVDNKGRIFVLDPNRNNIRIFEKKNNE